MSLAILDARQWQQVVDLRSGHKIETDAPLVGMVKGVLARHPFPGDRDPRGNDWVTDTALDLIERYDPGFAFLTYARQYYCSRYSPLTATEREAMREEAFAEVERFARESGFATVIVGTGGMTRAVAPIDLTGLDGLAVASNWSARYAGLYGLSARDMDRLSGHPDLERVASREEMLELFGGGPDDGGRLPEQLAVARAGRYFNTTSLRRLVMLPAPSPVVPVSANLDGVASVTDVKNAVLARLGREKVAIALLEGLGCEDFPAPFTACRNGRGWYCYEPGDSQYLALTTGGHRVFEHNGGYRYYLDDTERKPYPFSGYFTALPSGTIGEAYPGRSIAVGNRSMFMHVTTGCDIACECFARNLYNQGLMAVIHRQDKPAGAR
ncbi:hypothetical protein DFW101_1991 [Solidesulfovibrio carbinoliphilus subsp. oakridgensis]|uniref:Uncharacterized protein n=1 Tax=Solidesulfovibrio carbinoliphilus subsp. oakridgensis TaxID=694327 RepID=G7Q6R2_9BACT|nr:hypothetical protein [Solidesulfovibrio carbinoliphilus]EHJ47997.1 hypothetical protein DFW101_1991 [Solidesulfovibrio carbinoliphilus subsp. oakridgensis]